MLLSECKHEMELVQAELDDTTPRLYDLEQTSRRVFTTLREFARKHETQLTSNAHDLTSDDDRRTGGSDEADDKNVGRRQ